LADLGLAYYQVGDTQAALDTLQLAVLTDPGDANAHYTRALVLMAEDDYYSAMLEADASLQLAPGHADAMALRATANLYMERWEDAAEDFQLAYEMNPAYVEALFGLARAQAQLGQTDAAIATLQHYLAVAPPDSVGHLEAQALLEQLEAEGGS
jgi:tetratricopeptide (TPR) repeat protein